eukprot:3178489-Amphidinium_carterae.1
MLRGGREDGLRSTSILLTANHSTKPVTAASKGNSQQRFDAADFLRAPQDTDAIPRSNLVNQPPPL